MSGSGVVEHHQGADGGTLISADVVLTAAHCLHELPAVYVGGPWFTLDEVIDADGDWSVDAGVTRQGSILRDDPSLLGAHRPRRRVGSRPGTRGRAARARDPRRLVAQHCRSVPGSCAGRGGSLGRGLRTSRGGAVCRGPTRRRGPARRPGHDRGGGARPRRPRGRGVGLGRMDSVPSAQDIARLRDGVQAAVTVLGDAEFDRLLDESRSWPAEVAVPWVLDLIEDATPT